MGAAKPVGVHLVGSAPFETPARLFDRVGRELGSRLSRVPDGEPGARNNWIMWQRDVLERSAQLEIVSGEYFGEPEVALRQGADAAAIEIGELGYAREAVASYGAFVAAKEAGAVPAAVRFQVSLPTPLGVLAGGIVEPGSRRALEPAYEAAMLGELERICAAIPHDQLAIQWDLCLETLLWESSFEAFTNSEWWEETARREFWGGHAGIVERSVRMTEAVPAGVEAGFHFCYGDYGNQHDVQPRDLGNVCELAEGVRAALARPLHWLHVPVPADRHDAGYFEPLADLEPRPETELYLGLLHLGDGEAGAAARIAAARSAVSSFGLATECGWGRRSPNQVGELIGLHASTTDPVR